MEAFHTWPIVAQALGFAGSRRTGRNWRAQRRLVELLPVSFHVDVEPIVDDVVMLTPYLVVAEP